MGYSFERQKGTTITNAFQKNLDESKHKPNEIPVVNESSDILVIR